MELGEHGDAIGADLVRGIAIGGDAVGTDDDRLDPATLHEVRRHVVADQRDRHARTLEFERGEARALQQRTRLIREHCDALAISMRLDDAAQRGADTAGGESAGVAVGQHATANGQQRRPVGSDTRAQFTVFTMDALGLHQQPGAHLHRGQMGDMAVEAVAHAFQRPAQVDRRRPAGDQTIERMAQRFFQQLGTLARGLGCAAVAMQHQTVSPSNADGRRPAYHQGDDRLTQRLQFADLEITHFSWQAGLIDQHQHAIVKYAAPFDAAQHTIGGCGGSTDRLGNRALGRLAGLGRWTRAGLDGFSCGHGGMVLRPARRQAAPLSS